MSSGVSFMTQGNFNGESGFLIPNFRANTTGVYTRQSYVQDAVTIDTGLRLDLRSLTAYPREERTRGEFVRREHRYSGLSAVTGIIWRFTEHWSLSSNAGLAWRPPGVNELYNFGVHHGTAQFEIGNPDLHSERSYNLDATVRHVGLHATAEVSIYRNQMDGYIHLFPEDEPRVTIRGTFPSFRYAQSDAVLTGIDGAFEYDLLTDRLTLGASASIVRGTDVERDEPLIFMPSDRFSGFTEWTFPTVGRFIHPAVMLEARHSARQDRVPPQADFAPPPDAYTLFSAGIHTDIDLGTETPASLSLDVENLFDTAYRDYMSRYRYFIGDPGRNVILRLTVPLG